MKNILVIEDNSNVRENICEILELAGYKVNNAANGKLGVAAAKELTPDLILCDIMMPELDGYGVLHILSKTPQTAGIPFIFLTAKAEKEDFRMGMNLGADDYITKPFKELDLLDTIEKRLKKVSRLRATGSPEGGSSFSALFSEAKAMKSFEKLAEEYETRTIPAKQFLFSEGTYAHHVCYMLSGKVKLFRSNDAGKEFITDVLTEGDFVGHFAIIENKPHTNSALAIEDSSCIIIPKEDFLQLLYKDRDVANQFIRILSNQVDDKAEKLISLAYNSVRKRVADAIMEIYTRDGTSEFHISREDLANLTGTSKETVIRTLSDFKEEGFIRIEKNKIHVLAPQALSDIIA